MEIQLVIKAPNQNIEDHTVHCNLDWTVRNVKDHLSGAYPNKPEVEDQKLIYSGRLLHDHLHLRDILRHEDDQPSVHILHLVCNASPSTSQDQNAYTSQDWSNPSTSNSQTGNEPSAGQSTESNLRHRNTSSAIPNNTFYPQFQQGLTPPAPMPVFVPDTQVAAQIAAMQQMYAYYFTQYIQSVNMAPGSENNGVFPGNPNYQQPFAPNEAPAPGRPVNQRMNAQGGQGLEENDELINRDWLDHLFLCCRFMVLFCVVYFYSTPERLMIVIVCAIIAFLYHEGWFVRRANPAVIADTHQRNPNNPEVPLENNENATPLVNQDLSANDEQLTEHELEAAMDGDDPPHAQHIGQGNNYYVFSLLTFLTSFFSSLIPDPPPAVNIN